MLNDSLFHQNWGISCSNKKQIAPKNCLRERQAGLATAQTFGLHRLTPFPWTPRQCAIRKPIFQVAFLLRIALMILAGFECCVQHHRRSAVVVLTVREYTTEVTLLKEIYRWKCVGKR